MTLSPLARFKRCPHIRFTFLLIKALRHHKVPSWIELYVKRWLTAPFQNADGSCVQRTSGVPQGGVVSPLLMNLFMHYAFDAWMRRTFPLCEFARYADDAVVHCRTKWQADRVYGAIADRLRECGLTMHPDKSAIVYCKDSNRRGNHELQQFTFLGFTFWSRKAINRQGQIFTSFLPAVSSAALKRMRGIIRSWRLVRRTPATLDGFSEKYNRVLRGWWQYYGAFYPTELIQLGHYLDERLTHWARRKYKRLAGHRSLSWSWLKRMKQAMPWLFVHWENVGG
jgi:RNA-directed DNA polymerase